MAWKLFEHGELSALIRSTAEYVGTHKDWQLFVWYPAFTTDRKPPLGRTKCFEYDSYEQAHRAMTLLFDKYDKDHVLRDRETKVVGQRKNR